MTEFNVHSCLLNYFLVGWGSKLHCKVIAIRNLCHHNKFDRYTSRYSEYPCLFVIWVFVHGVYNYSSTYIITSTKQSCQVNICFVFNMKSTTD